MKPIPVKTCIQYMSDKLGWKLMDNGKRKDGAYVYVFWKRRPQDGLEGKLLTLFLTELRIIYEIGQ